MIEKVYEHIVKELHDNSRTDTIFILAAGVLNLITLGVNSAVASGAINNVTATIVMFIFVGLTLVVNISVIAGLFKGKQSRVKLLNGLLKMYKDQNVEGYYDTTLLGNYKMRYTMFMIIVIATALVAIIVPFVIFATA